MNWLLLIAVVGILWELYSISRSYDRLHDRLSEIQSKVTEIHRRMGLDEEHIRDAIEYGLD